MSEWKNRYVLVAVDYATRFPEAIAFPGVTAERIAESLWEIWTGCPERDTDRDTQFVSELMKQVNKLLAIK